MSGDDFKYGLGIIAGVLGSTYLLLNIVHKVYQILDTRETVRQRRGKGRTHETHSGN